MDLDIEMDVDDVQDVPIPAVPQAYTNDIITGEEQEPGEVEEALDDRATGDVSDKALVPYKVHLRGLDTFNPDDVKAYLAEHYSTSQFNRIEWIDDTSANLIFKSESVAQEALVALAAVDIADPTQLPPLEDIPAKSYSKKPESMLRVRVAVAGDKKVAGAAERSRFYLLHPEYDPEERRRRGEFSRGKYRDRDDRYRRDRRGGRRRSDDDAEPFDVNLYDDDASARATRTRRRSTSRRRSASSSSETKRASSRIRRNREKELFPGRTSGGGASLRDRSASPPRDRDGDAEMDLDEDARAAAALRSRERGRSIKERLLRDNSAKELFPSKVSNKAKELFPDKVSSSSSGKAQMDQISETTVLASASLADRITPRPTTAASGGFSIRGMASKRGNDPGIAIKGTGPSVKELFPEKFGNAGKELFAEKLEGRGRRRQRAEDSFY
ncbi:uncharacterized protein THITE_2106837 [Thermothielavioides terrestris NRRL 8126]|uniref:Uncharacterized protein n=1 Tax=Thermothielavioides terrestris (strain ATCC 38088 / NRRL 8126) TaxID=578455 RepID=G2QRJ6_THETT|nr:uncharacterized protein THITE_2106837 [Thermothielavioides terrestris NRRL 8126]AEO62541.1 hypothetical protein THITE_2106837 [Thermothielavioides terrestris NRRL 8126]